LEAVLVLLESLHSFTAASSSFLVRVMSTLSCQINQELVLRDKIKEAAFF
jgi:hypothetical protein